METFLILFVFGAIIGSFLNVVILRRGAQSLGGRSACMACAQQLQWYDMIPIFSWMYLHGRCRNCKTKISIQYPLVEMLTALLFVFVGSVGLSPVSASIGLVLVSLLVCLAVYDVEHMVLPDEWVLPFVVGTFIFSMSTFQSSQSWSGVVWLLISALCAALPLFILFAVSKGRWMGFGDVKLALGIGFLLSLPLGVVTVFFSFIVGAVFFLCVMAGRYCVQQMRKVTHTRDYRYARAQLTMKSEVPFGPFLIASCLFVWILTLYGYDVLSILLI